MKLNPYYFQNCSLSLNLEISFYSCLHAQASDPAKELLEEKDRRKFFQKYSSVSQELEKCLDCLLLISDSVTALGEEDTLGK